MVEEYKNQNSRQDLYVKLDEATFNDFKEQCTNSLQLTQRINYYCQLFHKYYLSQEAIKIIELCHNDPFVKKVSFSPEIPSSFTILIVDIINLLHGNDIPKNIKEAIINLLVSMTSIRWISSSQILSIKNSNQVSIIEALVSLVAPYNPLHNTDPNASIFDFSNFNILVFDKKFVFSFLCIITNLSDSESELVSQLYFTIPLRYLFPLYKYFPQQFLLLIFNLTQFPLPETDHAEIIQLFSTRYNNSSSMEDYEFEYISYIISQQLNNPSFPIQLFMKSELHHFLVDCLGFVPDNSCHKNIIVGSLNCLIFLQKKLDKSFSPNSLADNNVVLRRLKDLLFEEENSQNHLIKNTVAKVFSLMIFIHPDHVQYFFDSAPGLSSESVLNDFFILYSQSSFGCKLEIAELLICITNALPSNLQTFMIKNGLISIIIEVKGKIFKSGVEMLDNLIIRGQSGMLDDILIDQDIDFEDLGDFIASNENDFQERQYAACFKTKLLSLPRIKASFLEANGIPS